jgi:probable rRNA maturation factor
VHLGDFFIKTKQKYIQDGLRMSTFEFFLGYAIMVTMTANWTIDIQVDPGYRRLLKVRRLRQIAVAVLAAEAVKPGAKLSLVLTNDDTVKELNRKYRGQDKTTDVLAFPLGEDSAAFVSPPRAAAHLGEVVISYPQASRQAKEAGHTLEKELALLIVHGVLHILGYDHQRAAQGQRMRAREQAILGQIFD